jgi:uncharacterized protein DUF2510
MTAGGDPRAVTICERWRVGLYADDLGVTVRRSASRADRFVWAEVSRFADGCQSTDTARIWMLLIGLHAGREVAVECEAWGPVPETVRAIRQVAERRGIPAEVTGLPMIDGRPAEHGLYEDPGGQPGLRYWDGTEWSPLLTSGVRKAGTARKSAGSWSALPVVAGPWQYAAARARRSGVRFAVLAAVSAVATAGLGIELWWHPGMPHRNTVPALWCFTIAFGMALGALLARADRREFLNLEEAAGGSADGLEGPAS